MADINIVRWTDASLTLTFSDKDWPTNLTGSTVFFTMKKRDKLNLEDPTDENAVIKTQRTTHLDPVAGKTVWYLTKEQTRVESWQYVADFQVIDSIGKISNTKVFDAKIWSDATQRTS